MIKTEEVEGNLKNLRRIISWHKVAGDGKGWMGLYWTLSSTMDWSAWKEENKEDVEWKKKMNGCVSGSAGVLLTGQHRSAVSHLSAQMIEVNSR
jgi:hypothetical protein